MRVGRFSGLVLATGAMVGVAAVVGLVIGFEPARLPPALLNIAVYKLTFAAAAGLLAAGAIIRRHGNRDAADRGSQASERADASRETGLLPDAQAPHFAPKSGRPVEDRVPKQP